MNNTTEIKNQPLQKHFSLEPQITWYWSLRIIISLATVLGNGFVIFLITTRKSLQVTCNWFVLSLAISDFCVGLVITPTGLTCAYWARCDWRLELVFYNFLLSASTLNLWAMTFDRYNAIVCPFKYITLMTAKRTLILISLPWITILLASFIRLSWLYDDDPRTTVDTYYRVVIDLWLGVFTCILLLVIYVKILIIIRKHSRQLASLRAQLSFNTSSRIAYRNKQERLSAKILGAVISLFVACYFINIYVSFCSNFKLCSPPSNVYIASILMVHANGAVNFLVYALLKKDFRTELRRLYKCQNEVTAAEIRGLGLTTVNGHVQQYSSSEQPRAVVSSQQ